MFQVNEADDPKAEDCIIPSENKHETARNRATDAADKFQHPSRAASDDRESEEITKIKRLKYDEDEDGRH